MDIVNEDIDKWLSVLKPFQRDTIKALLRANDGDEEKVAQLWLSSFGPINTVTFGGLPSSASKKDYFKCLKEEINKFICGGDSYEEDRTKILDGVKMINVGVATKIASILAPIVGVSVAILTPPVVLMFHAIGKITVNAYCAMVKTDA